MAKRENWGKTALIRTPAELKIETLDGKFDTGETAGTHDLILINDNGDFAGWCPCSASLAATDWRVVALEVDEEVET